MGLRVSEGSALAVSDLLGSRDAERLGTSVAVRNGNSEAVGEGTAVTVRASCHVAEAVERVAGRVGGRVAVRVAFAVGCSVGLGLGDREVGVRDGARLPVTGKTEAVEAGLAVADSVGHAVGVTSCTVAVGSGVWEADGVRDPVSGRAAVRVDGGSRELVAVAEAVRVAGAVTDPAPRSVAVPLGLQDRDAGAVGVAAFSERVAVALRD